MTRSVTAVNAFVDNRPDERKQIGSPLNLVNDDKITMAFQIKLRLDEFAKIRVEFQIKKGRAILR